MDVAYLVYKNYALGFYGTNMHVELYKVVVAGVVFQWWKILGITLERQV